MSLVCYWFQDCEGDELQCDIVRCNIVELQPGNSAVITFHARLWNRTISQVSTRLHAAIASNVVAG